MMKSGICGLGPQVSGLLVRLSSLASGVWFSAHSGLEEYRIRGCGIEEGFSLRIEGLAIGQKTNRYLRSIFGSCHDSRGRR